MDKAAIVEKVARECYGDRLQSEWMEIAKKVGMHFLTAAGYFDLLEVAQWIDDEFGGMMRDLLKHGAEIPERHQKMLNRLHEVLRKAGVEVE